MDPNAPPVASGRVPDFVIIGAQKSASTFLQNCMTAHPDVWMPRGESAYFESPDYEREGPDGLGRPCAGRREARVGIKRPNYIGRPEVPGRLLADLPNAKLFAVLRNPVDRAVSAWFHLMKSGFLPVMPLEEGMNALLDEDGRVASHPRAAEVLSFGRYGEHLGAYRGALEDGRLLVFLHEEILADPAAALAAAFGHVGVDPGFALGDVLTQRPQAVVYQPTRLRLLSLRPKLLYAFDPGRTRVTGRTRNPLRVAAAAGVVATDRALLRPLLGNPRPEPSAALRERLLAHYASDLDRLEALLGKSPEGWRSPRDGS